MSAHTDLQWIQRVLLEAGQGVTGEGGGVREIHIGRGQAGVQLLTDVLILMGQISSIGYCSVSDV